MTLSVSDLSDENIKVMQVKNMPYVKKIRKEEYFKKEKKNPEQLRSNAAVFYFIIF